MAESAQKIREEIEATKSQLISKLRTLEGKLSFGKQLHKHPWFSLGSAAALGYVASHFKIGRATHKTDDRALNSPVHSSDKDALETAVVGDTAIDAIPPLPHHPKWSLSSSITHNTKAIIAQIVIEAAQRAVAQAVPMLIARSMQQNASKELPDGKASGGVA